MGRYADPQMIVDKRFEKAQAQLDKMYTNVAQNIGQITARKKKKKQALADKYSNAAGRYLKETATFRKDSNDFAQTRNMNAEKKQAFSDNLASKYNEGYVNIQNYIKQGNHTDAEIQEFVNKQINLAGGLSRKILTLEGMASDWSEAVNAAGKSEGKNTGSAVVGSAYSDILSTMTETNDIDGKIQWDKMGLVGSLDPSIDANGNPVPEDKRVGFNIFFDTNLGKDAQEGIIDPGEILNLDAAEKNFTKGKKEYYYQTVKDDKDIYTTTFKSSLKATNKTKKGNFMTTVTYVDENGATQQKSVVDKTKRQDYFLSGDGQDLLNSVVDGNEAMLIQKYFGAQAAAKLDDPPKEQDIVKLKVKMLERLDPDFDDGDQKLIMNKSTKSNQFTKNTNHEVVRGFYEDTHTKTANFVTAGDPKEALKEYNRYLQDRPYSQGAGAKTYTIGRMNIIKENPLQVELVSKSGTKLHSSYFDLTTDEGRKKLEEGLMKGNFQGTSDQKHVDGYMQAAYTTEQGKTFGTGDLDAYEGAQSTTTRITNSGVQGTLTYDQYKNLEADKKDKLTSTTMEWSWDKKPKASANKQLTPEELNTLNKKQIKDKEAKFKLDDQTPTEQGLQTSTQDVPGSGDPDGDGISGYNMKYSSLTIPVMDNQGQPTGEKKENYNNFGGKEYDESGRVGDKAVYTKDASGNPENTLDNQYRKIINFETVGGLVDGSGVGDYGFTDPKYDGKEPKSPEEAVKMIKTEIVPEVETELGFSIDDLKGPPQVTASLVDYKMNTGRKMDDLLLIAYQNQSAIDGKQETKAWDGISAATQTAPKPTQEIYDALKAGKITPEAIASAKDELYVGRIKYMRDQLNKKPADRDKSFRSTEADYKNAVEGYRNSHSNRVNMFK